MKITFYPILSFITLFIIGCGRSPNKFTNVETNSTTGYYDSLTTLSRVIKNSNEKEKMSLDSVRKYRIDSLNSKCKNFLYTLYYNDTILNKDTDRKITVGECNIRLVNFKSKSSNVKSLSYNFFINDSIPITWQTGLEFYTNWINTFEVDIKSKEILLAKIAEHAYIKMNSINHSYDSIKGSVGFKEYLLKYKNRLHPNFHY